MRTATMSLLFVERISQESTILRNKHKRKYREITVPMGKRGITRGGEKEREEGKRGRAKVRSYARSDCLLTYLNV